MGEFGSHSDPMKQRVVVVAATVGFGLGLAGGWLIFSDNGGGSESPSTAGGGEAARKISGLGVDRSGGGTGASESGSAPSPAGGVSHAGTLSLADKIYAIPVVTDGVVVRELDPLLSGLDGAGYAALMLELNGKLTGRRKQRVIWAIAEKFAQVDPRAAIEFAGDPANYQIRSTTMMRAAVAHLVGESPDEAARFISNLKPGYARSNALNTLFETLALTDTERFLEWINDDERIRGLFGARKVGVMMEPFRAVAADDPVKAIGLLDRIDFGNERESALHSIAENWAQVDPHSAFDWASGLAESERGGAIQQVFEGGANAHPEALVSLFERVSDETMRTGIARTMAEEWAEIDGRAAMRWAASLEDGKAREEAIEEIFDEIEGRDPASIPELLELVGEVPENSRSDYINAVARWARDEPEDAHAWASQLEDESERERALQGVMRSFVALEPERVAEFLLSGPEERRSSSSVRTLMASWMESDLDAAEAWSQQLDGAARIYAVDTLIDDISYRDPQRAAGMLADLLDSQTVAEEHAESLSSARRIATTLGPVDPEGAAAVLRRLPAGQTRVSAIDQLAIQWVREDLRGASEWAAELQPGAERDAVASRIVHQIGTDDPVGALAWAASILDPNVRLVQLRSALAAGRGDVDQMGAAIRSASLDEAERQMLLNELEVRLE